MLNKNTLFQQLIDSKGVVLATVDPNKFNVRDLPSIWKVDATQNWLVEGLIPLESMTLLTGESGSGKSSISLALASAVSLGEPFLGRATVKRPVLIIDRENGATIYHERIQRFGLEETPDLMVWGHWSGPEPGAPTHPAIAEFVTKEKPLLVFDSLVAFHPGSEQDSTETRKYMDQFRRLVGLGATIIIVHHTGKGEFTKEYRGSSDIKASVDVALVLVAKSPLLKLLSLRPFKSREGVVDPIQITLDGQRFTQVDGGYVTPEDPDWKLVGEVVGRNPGCSQSQLAKLMPQMKAPKVRKILLAGEIKGIFRTEKGLKNAYSYFLGAPKNAQ